MAPAGRSRRDDGYAARAARVVNETAQVLAETLTRW